MSIDMKKMQQRLQGLKNRGGSSSGLPRLKIKVGDKLTLRIVPTPDGDPFKDYWYHYNVGKAFGFLSPKKNFGEPDVLDDFVYALFREAKEQESEALKEQAKDLMAKQRFFSPVVVRGQEELGVQIWGYSKTVYEELLALVLNEEYGDITDIQSGLDIDVTCTKAATEKFPRTKPVAKRNSSPLSKNKEEIRLFLEQVESFASCFEKDRKTPEEVKVILEEYLASLDKGEAESADASMGASRYGNNLSSSSADDDEDSEYGSRVDDSFEELVNS